METHTWKAMTVKELFAGSARALADKHMATIFDVGMLEVPAADSFTHTELVETNLFVDIEFMPL